MDNRRQLVRRWIDARCEECGLQREVVLFLEPKLPQAKLRCPRCASLRVVEIKTGQETRRCSKCKHFEDHPTLPEGCCMHRTGPVPPDGYCESWTRIEKKKKCKCCARGDEYNGFNSDGPHLFDCPKGCACHD
jgi:hypothetical protein